MKQVVIENPMLNSPFEEPGRHFKFSDEGITDEVVEARRDVCRDVCRGVVGVGHEGHRLNVAGPVAREDSHEVLREVDVLADPLAHLARAALQNE